MVLETSKMLERVKEGKQRAEEERTHLGYKKIRCGRVRNAGNVVLSREAI